MPLAVPGPGRDEARCGVCGQAIGASSRPCPACETPFHSDCWDYNHGCAVYACPGISPVRSCDLSSPAVDPITSGMASILPGSRLPEIPGPRRRGPGSRTRSGSTSFDWESGSLLAGAVAAASVTSLLLLVGLFFLPCLPLMAFPLGCAWWYRGS